MKTRIVLTCSMLLAACSSGSDRYKDTLHLELPPTLPVEHRAQTAENSENVSKPSVLANMIEFSDDEKHPKLVLKTRLERAWEIMSTAIKISDMILADKSRDDSKFEVLYDADHVADETGFFAELLNNRYEQEKYIITLNAKRTNEIQVNVVPADRDLAEADDNGTAQLIRLLANNIDNKILNRTGRQLPISE